jgi:hypothetical protein
MKATKIIAAIQGVTAKWAKQRKREEREQSAIMYRRDRMVRTRRMTLKDAAYDCMEKAYLAASANGTLPANARQVMYQARPIIQAATGRKLDDQYFTQTLLPDYMTEFEVAWDVVFDDHGHFFEPHTAIKVGLGTIAVRNYLSGVIEEPEWEPPELSNGAFKTHGPAGRFGAVLFCEKEGFFQLFEATKLAERYDLAIMSTKGLSNTAARSLVDGLCGHSIPLLVLHDFDKAGLSILATLQNDTRRYTFSNNVEVIDLGLRLSDIKALGLEAKAEKPFDRGTREARARNLRQNGATSEEVAFLLDRRVELNALASDALVSLIERKLAKHNIKKVIPDKETLADIYRAAVQAERVEEAVQNALEEVEAGAVKVPAGLAGKVKLYLQSNPTTPWDKAVVEIARENPGQHHAPPRKSRLPRKQLPKKRRRK